MLFKRKFNCVFSDTTLLKVWCCFWFSRFLGNVLNSSCSDPGRPASPDEGGHPWSGPCSGRTDGRRRHRVPAGRQAWPTKSSDNQVGTAIISLERWVNINIVWLPKLHVHPEPAVENYGTSSAHIWDIIVSE